MGERNFQRRTHGYPTCYDARTHWGFNGYRCVQHVWPVHRWGIGIWLPWKASERRNRRAADGGGVDDDASRWSSSLRQWHVHNSLGGMAMYPQWPQAKGSNGRQAERQVRLDAETRQSWGGGRWCLHSGRKSKETTAGKPRDKFGLMTKHGPARATHSLSVCVGANKAIGRNNSPKWWRNQTNKL